MATATAIRSTTRSGSQAATILRAFLAICWRDIFVTGRQLPIFLAQVLLQPIFFLFIFGRILTDLNYASAGFASLLLPGIIGFTIFVTTIQSTALPLVLEFSFSKEIEDRLLAPLPVAMVGLQKIVIAAVRGLIGGAVIFPLGAWILGGSLQLSTDHIPLTIVSCILAALVGSGIGLTLGTVVDARSINIMFALILTPLLFTGCTQYPWSLLDKPDVHWFQIVTLFNPLTYASEGLRAALVPGIQHMNTAVAILVLCVATLLFAATGIWGFVRRAVD